MQTRVTRSGGLDKTDCVTASGERPGSLKYDSLSPENPGTGHRQAKLKQTKRFAEIRNVVSYSPTAANRACVHLISGISCTLSASRSIYRFPEQQSAIFYHANSKPGLFDWKSYSTYTEYQGFEFVPESSTRSSVSWFKAGCDPN